MLPTIININSYIDSIFKIQILISILQYKYYKVNNNSIFYILISEYDSYN